MNCHRSILKTLTLALILTIVGITGKVFATVTPVGSYGSPGQAIGPAQMNATVESLSASGGNTFYCKAELKNSENDEIKLYGVSSSVNNASALCSILQLASDGKTTLIVSHQNGTGGNLHLGLDPTINIYFVKLESK